MNKTEYGIYGCWGLANMYFIKTRRQALMHHKLCFVDGYFSTRKKAQERLKEIEKRFGGDWESAQAALAMEAEGNGE